MAQPPAGASLLFTAISPEASLRKYKGYPRLEMTGVRKVNWFTDRPDRAEGTWKPTKLERRWYKYFPDSAEGYSGRPNASIGFRVAGIAGEIGFANFEMFRPKIKCVDRCDDENLAQYNIDFKLESISKKGEDKLTNLMGKDFIITSLFIDPATPGVPSCFPDCLDADLRGLDMSGQNLVSDFTRADMRSKNKTKTNLSDSYLYGADLEGAKLNGAKLNGATLQRANLVNAKLNGADLTDAYLWEAELTGATHDPKTVWPNAKYWDNTTCPDGSNSDNNPSCGF